MNLIFLDSEGNKLKEITQWDINRKVEITGIQPHEIIEVHFYNAVSTRALVVDPVVELEKIIVDIPNILVQQATDLFMAVFVKDGKEGKTEQIYSIPVRKKKKPESYTYEENIDYVSWVELSEKAKKQLAEMQAIIDDVNNKLQSGEFEGNGIKSITKIKTEGLTDIYRIEFTKGQPFEYNVTNGYTPIKGKDYFTEEEKAEMVETTKTKVVTIVEKDSANSIDLSIDSNYLMTANLKNKQGQTISTATIDFPIESMVINASYSNGKLTLTLQNGNNLEVDISAIVSGLVNETTFNAKVKELNQQIANANQEIDQLTGEVSDIKLQQGTFKQEQTLQNANIDKNTNDIHTLINAISTISPTYDKETIKAEEITITDGTENPAKIEIYGNTKQKTTEGYNTFTNVDNTIKDNYGIETIMKNSICEVKGKATEGYWPTTIFLADKTIKQVAYYPNSPISLEKFFNEKDTDYTLKIDYEASEPTGTFFLLYKDRVGSQPIKKGKNTFKEKLNTLSKLNGIGIGIPSNSTNLVKAKITIYEGTEEKEWEPYTGGQASPNPEFPQDIESVKAYNLFDCVNQLFNNTSGKTKLSRIPTGIRATQTETATGTFYADMVLDSKIFKKGKVYTISTIAKPNTSNRPRILLEYSNQKGLNSESIGSSYGDPITFTYNPPVEKPYLLFTLYSSASGTALANSYIDYENILLIEGNKNKPYSPYGEIAVKQTGKNLFDKSKSERGILTEQGIVFDDQLDFWTSDFIRIKSGINYYKSLTNSIRIKIYDINKNIFTNQTYSDLERFNIAKTFKIENKNAYYIRFSYQKQLESNIQIEEGTEPTPYEPYKETIYPVKLGNIELNKLGDKQDDKTERVQDYFHKIDNKWYLHNEIEKRLLTGNENITQQLISGTICFEVDIKNRVNATKKQYSNYFVHKQWSLTKDKNYFYCLGSVARFLEFKYARTKEEFVQWLKNNPTEIVYALETPKEEEITDPTLIEQLNALDNTMTYKGTNILTNNSIAIMKLDYIADTKIYLDGLFKTVSVANNNENALQKM